jgi:hypothetical protein
MRLGPGLLYEGRTLQGARPKLADFCSATMAEFYSAVDIGTLSSARFGGYLDRSSAASLRPPSYGVGVFRCADLVDGKSVWHVHHRGRMGNCKLHRRLAKLL